MKGSNSAKSLRFGGFRQCIFAKCQKDSKYVVSVLDPGEIAFRDFLFRLKKSLKRQKVPDPVGSAVFV